MPDGKSSLIVDVRPGDSLTINGVGVSIVLVKKSGQAARLWVTAPESVRIEKISAHEGFDHVASMA